MMNRRSFFASFVAIPLAQPGPNPLPTACPFCGSTEQRKLGYPMNGYPSTASAEYRSAKAHADLMEIRCLNCKLTRTEDATEPTPFLPKG